MNDQQRKGTGTFLLICGVIIALFQKMENPSNEKNWEPEEA